MNGYIDMWKSPFYGQESKEEQLLENLASSITDYTRTLNEIRDYCHKVGGFSVDKLMQEVFNTPLQDSVACFSQMMGIAAAFIKRRVEEEKKLEEQCAETTLFDDDDDYTLDPEPKGSKRYGVSINSISDTGWD